MRTKVVAPFAVDLERLIIAFGEQLWMPSSQLQKSADAEQLLAAVLPTSRKIGYRGANDFVEQGPPRIESTGRRMSGRQRPKSHSSPP